MERKRGLVAAWQSKNRDGWKGRGVSWLLGNRKTVTDGKQKRGIWREGKCTNTTALCSPPLCSIASHPFSSSHRKQVKTMTFSSASNQLPSPLKAPSAEQEQNDRLTARVTAVAVREKHALSLQLGREFPALLSDLCAVVDRVARDVLRRLPNEPLFETMVLSAAEQEKEFLTAALGQEHPALNTDLHDLVDRMSRDLI
jgi:hypothetical protein